MSNNVDSDLLLKTVEHSPASIVITDVYGNIEYVNNKFTEVTGYSKKEVIGKNPRVLKSDKQDSEYYKEMWKILSSGKEWKGEFCNKRKNGEEYWEIVSISSFKNEKNEIVKYVAVKEDITERKQMEKILKMKDFSIETARDGMMWLDTNGIITYVNKSYCEMLNCKEKDIHKKKLSWFDIVPKESKETWIEYWDILKLKKSLTLEHYHCINKKKIFPIESSLNYFILDGVENIFVFTRDISDRKIMENKLRLSEEKFSKSFMFNPDAITITELETSKYIDVNEAFETLCGWKREECIGKTIYDLNIWKHLEKRNEMIELLHKNNGIFYNYELQIILKNGEERTGLMAGRIINYDGKDRLLTITKDISDRKKYEIELKEAKEKAEVSDKLKSSFLANMSHEIRTPMNSIIGFADLLKDENLTNEDKLSYIKIINDSSNDLLSLIDEIIDIAKIEAGQMKLDISEYYIENILEEVYNTYYKKVNQNVNFICENINDDKLLVKTDAYRIKQILTNLITNAIKFTSTGIIEFGYHVKNDLLEFFVKDTGIGIEESNLNMIFDRFRQVDESKTRRYGGTGLGLNICLNLVNMMGGKIWVESKFGEGSTFYFSVPYIQSDDYTKNIEIKNINNNYNWSEYKILVVEDVKPNFIFIQEVLKTTNAQIYWAVDGEEAVEIFKKVKPHVILMDLQMPKLNGFEAREKILKINKNVIIIAQTAYAMVGDKIRCLKEGFDDYISKPINKHLLLSKIDIHLNKK